MKACSLTSVHLVDVPDGVYRRTVIAKDMDAHVFANSVNYEFLSH